jgi:hypothetical protein
MKRTLIGVIVTAGTAGVADARIVVGRSIHGVALGQTKAHTGFGTSGL